MQPYQLYHLFCNTARDCGYPLPSQATILDLGCGNGNVVQACRDHGIHAFGCDIKFKPGPHAAELERKGWMRKIEPGQYRIPFEDETFDFIMSFMVFEHIRDYPTTLQEICRVLRPQGVNLNIFPSRYTPIEPHVFVPLATVFQQYPWLRLWASLGVRKANQKGMSARETAAENYHYLNHYTNYLNRKQLEDYFCACFCRVEFATQAYLKNSRRGRLIYALSRYLPFLPDLVSTFRTRVVLLRKACDDQ
ncbi:MAG: class I SAM-dependent methyltransferase [Chloroflexi bacterium]|nr:class I SAM-dependent methyltransferase [Chloroflexota bacterium]